MSVYNIYIICRYIHVYIHIYIHTYILLERSPQMELHPSIQGAGAEYLAAALLTKAFEVTSVLRTSLYKPG